MTTPRPVMGRWFEDLTPGLVLDHAITRTITEADNTFRRRCISTGRSPRPPSSASAW
jgi:hypothetical protein